MPKESRPQAGNALRAGRGGIGHVPGAAQIDNGILISRPDGSPAPDNAPRVPNAGFEAGGTALMRADLNAFFAIWVNSLSMSMVNFSCCVGSASTPFARGVTRRVTPQPTRAAFRMEAGVNV